MNDENSLQSRPPLGESEQQEALALSPKQLHSLYTKAKTFGIPFEVIEEVYLRGFQSAESNKERSGFDRVNSFIHGGKAAEIDNDLSEAVKDVAKELANDVVKTAFPHIHKALSKYIKKNKKKHIKEEESNGEPITIDRDKPSSRFIGTDSLTKILRNDTPGQARADVIKRVVRDKIKDNK